MPQFLDSRRLPFAHRQTRRSRGPLPMAGAILILLTALALVMLAGISPSQRALAQPAAPSEPAFDLMWLSPRAEATTAVAWGDVDKDGDLDLAVGNKSTPTRLILNQSGSLAADGWTAASSMKTTSLAWGDVDQDGDLDLVVGNEPEFVRNGARWECAGGQEQLYRNNGGQLTAQPVWVSKRCDATTGVALGDMDADGDLDLAIANTAPWQLCSALKECTSAQSLVYRNDDGVFTTEPVWTTTQPGKYNAPAWADVEGDGDLDLAVASAQGIYLFLSDDGRLRTVPSDIIAPGMDVKRLAWGDLDGKPSAGCDSSGPDLVAVGPSNASAFMNQCGAFQNTNTLLSRILTGDRPQPRQVVSALNPNGVPLWRSMALSQQGAALALGDVDSDGDLDLITGAGCSQASVVCKLHLYLYAEGQFSTEPVWTSTDDVSAFALAWGDVDGDGDLDLAVGAGGFVDASSRVYRNDTFPLDAQPIWTAPDKFVSSVSAWGDADGDGAPDLAIGLVGGQPALVRNDALGRTAAPDWQPSEPNATTSLAWGDVDADGDLDLAVGNALHCAARGLPEGCDPGHSRLYLNSDGALASTAAWTSGEADNTASLAWGDVDGDGDLDLAIGNRAACVDTGMGEQRCAGGQDRLYLNVAGTLAITPTWTTSISDTTTVLAWGDADGDGDLDLAVGNEGQPNLIYANESGMLAHEPAWTSARVAATTSLAWGDVDGDGDLDLAVGSMDEAVRLFLNNQGQIDTHFSWSSLETHALPTLAWGDVDGDGDLDLAVGDQIELALYENAGGALTNAAVWSPDLVEYGSLAWVDVERDSDMDLSVGRRLFRNLRTERIAADGLPTIVMRQPGNTAPADFYFTSEVLSGPAIPISYTLTTSGPGDRVDVKGYYSIDGQGAWRPATPVTGTKTTDLGTGDHVFLWDRAGDGLLGQSDAMAFRLVTVSRAGLQASGLPDPSLRGPANDVTAPFRLRGSQVQVFAESKDTPVADAVVYKLAAGQIDGAQLLANDLGPFRTNAGGYLLGRGEMKPGDRLVALWRPPGDQPSSGQYTLYYTSARPTDEGLAAATVQGSGIQELVVSQDNPLILFDLDVSLEWDARQDSAFLQELEQSIRRASEILYDISNGQMALGDVRVWQDKENWLHSDVIIYASGSVRPRASLGGVVDRATDDVGLDGQPIPSAFLPGQVRMGPVWDPFGQSRADLGREWWRALAHELAHHFLFLPDNYLGYGKAGTIITVDCQGSLMTTAYDDAYGELLDFTGVVTQTWPGDCAQTLAAHTTGRSDWETVKKFYPAVVKPSTPPGRPNSGPAVLPLDVTRVHLIEPVSDAQTYPARNFDLRDQARNRLMVPQGQGYLFKTGGNQDPTDDRLVPLGSTGQADFIKVRGASPQDRLCVFDFNSRPAQQGCIDKLGPLDSTITLVNTPEWAPDIQVAPWSLPVATISVSHPFTGSQAGVTATPLQSGLVVTVSQMTEAVARVSVGPAEGGSGTSVAISSTQSITNGELEFEVLQLTGGAAAISLSKPRSPGAPAVVTISQPALLVTVTQVISDGVLGVQVLPAYGSRSSAVLPMAPAAAGIYTAVVPLEYPVYAGYTRVAIEKAPAPSRGNQTGREAIAQYFFSAKRLSDGRYAWDAGPGFSLSPDPVGEEMAAKSMPESESAGLGPNDRGGFGPNDRGGFGPNDRGGFGPNDRGGFGPNDRGGFGPNDRGGFGPNDRGGFGPNDRGGFGPDVRGFNSNRRAMGAPIASSDGQVSIFNSQDVLGDTSTVALQALPVLPGLPSYLTPVGQGYRFVSGADLPRVIEFGYIQREVPQGYEHTLVIYYSADEGKTWRRLPTALEVDDNQATAPAQRSGLYVLVSSIDVPLYSAGWNLFSYPVPVERPVVDALRSISTTYSTVYGYDSANPADPWQVYDVRIPGWANDLSSLEFGRGYWIYITQPITLQLQVASGEPYSRTTAVVSPLNALVSQRTPPAVYYGSLPTEYAEGTTVEAWIEPPLGAEGDGQQCGQARVVPGDRPGEWRYVVKVNAADVGPTSGCGAPGKFVTFRLGEVQAQTVPWDNTAPIALDLVVGR